MELFAISYILLWGFFFLLFQQIGPGGIHKNKIVWLFESEAQRAAEMFIVQTSPHDCVAFLKESFYS